MSAAAYTEPGDPVDDSFDLEVEIREGGVDRLQEAVDVIALLALRRHWDAV